MNRNRARLTPVDVVLFGVVLFLLSRLAIPVYEVVQGSDIGTAPGYLFAMIFPAMILTVLSLIFITAVSGGAS